LPHIFIIRETQQSFEKFRVTILAGKKMLISAKIYVRARTSGIRSDPLAKPTAMKSEELTARAYADRLILEKLSEMEAAVKLGELADKLSDSGIGLAAVRSLMASNPDVFAYHERRWIPAARLSSEGRPVSEVLRAIIHSFGAPVALSTLVDEVSRVQGSSAESVEVTVRRLLEKDATFAMLGDERVGLVAWGFDAKDQKLARALALNGISEEEFEEISKNLSDVDFTSSDWAKQALAHAPIKLKEIGAVAYSKLNSDDPRSTLIYRASDLYQALFAVPGYVYNSDGTFVTEAEAKNLISAALKLANKLTPSIDVDDAAPIELKSEDVSRLVAKITNSEQTVTGTRLLEEFFEITPGTKTFPDDLVNIMNALRAEAKVAWVGGDRFRKAGDAPDYINEVPEPFQFVNSGVLNEEGEETLNLLMTALTARSENFSNTRLLSM
jgi:hypothetical protein